MKCKAGELAVLTIRNQPAYGQVVRLVRPVPNKGTMWEGSAGPLWALDRKVTVLTKRGNLLAMAYWPDMGLTPLQFLMSEAELKAEEAELK